MTGLLDSVRRTALLLLMIAAPLASAAPAPLLQLDVTHAGSRLVSAGERGQVLYSDDQGRHWQAAEVQTWQMLTALYFPDPQHGWAVGHDAQILATHDGGLHWGLQFQDPQRQAPLLDVWFKDSHRGFAVGAYGALLGTTDGGAHWQDLGDTLDNEDQLHLNAITATGDGTLFIVGEAGLMLRSTDSGEHWQRLASPYEGSLFGVLATAEPRTLLVYGLRGHLYRSTDAGDSWQAIEVADAHAGLAGGSLQNDGSLVLVGNAGSVLRSVDGGRSFSLLQRPDRQALSAVTGTADGHLVLAGQGGLQRATATGASLEQP